MCLPVLVHQRKIRRLYFLLFGTFLFRRLRRRGIRRLSVRSCCGSAFSCPFRPINGLGLLHLLLGSSSQLYLGQVAGDSVHKSGQGHNTHKDQQGGTDFHGIFHHIPLSLEEIEDRTGKDAYGKERNHKSQRINADEKETLC